MSELEDARQQIKDLEILVDRIGTSPDTFHIPGFKAYIEQKKVYMVKYHPHKDELRSMWDNMFEGCMIGLALENAHEAGVLDYRADQKLKQAIERNQNNADKYISGVAHNVSIEAVEYLESLLSKHSKE